jgi:hypothetical protein
LCDVKSRKSGFFRFDRFTQIKAICGDNRSEHPDWQWLLIDVAVSAAEGFARTFCAFVTFTEQETHS